jgi:hypothetical protein
VERHEIAGGSELLTVFGRLPDDKAETNFEDVPLVSVLRDNLGDDNPLNDRLRYVWVLTSASPTALQRAASALPFYYWRVTPVRMPIAAPFPPAHTVWTSLAGSLTQVAALDPEGAVAGVHGITTRTTAGCICWKDWPSCRGSKTSRRFAGCSPTRKWSRFRRVYHSLDKLWAAWCRRRWLPR